MTSCTFQPEVNAAREFVEIANDFANPLDLVREAISNAIDARAATMTIRFDVVKEIGESILLITLEDDGTGMDETTIRAFFDLGNSTRLGDAGAIGEKGHGTKVYFNSSAVEVSTQSGRKRIRAVMKEPYKTLFEKKVPMVEMEVLDCSEKSGTTVTIKGYNHNRRELFTHSRLMDYVLWFTKIGSVERQFDIETHKDFALSLKGLDRDNPETIPFGHPFPTPSASVAQLFAKHLADAPKHFCSKTITRGSLKRHPEVKVDAVFYVEGNRVKQSYNPMIRRQGYTPPDGGYTVQERYGIWLCKDYIPVQQVNDWVTVKGGEFTRLHAFVNCQELRLTANRGSVNNTPSEILADLRTVVDDVYESLTASPDWINMDWLVEEAEGYRNTEREKNDFANRLIRFSRANIATYKGYEIVEPGHETGVFGLILRLSTIEPTIFPFQILDYNTHTGIDLLVKGDHTTPLTKSRVFYVEMKYLLGTAPMNHSFENLSSIVCWDTQLKNGDIVRDLNDEERRVEIQSPGDGTDYTTYWLNAPKKAVKIEVIVLKDYLKERFGIEFRPRAATQ